MGAYLSEPVTEKVSSDGNGEGLKYGASSMQGWRVSQEDAHNCIVEFDKETSLFAVYDGHGGHEVAVYTAQKLPDFIKNTEAYKKGDMENALIDAFLGFDATIADRDVVAILKELAGTKRSEDSENETEDEENVSNLREEASMPIEQVIEKYQSGVNPNLKKLQGELPNSPYLRARRCENAAGSSSAKSSSSASEGCSSSSSSSGNVSVARAGGASRDISSGVGSSKCDDVNVNSSSDVNVVSSSNTEQATCGSSSQKTNHIEESAEVSSATPVKEASSPDSSNNVESNNKESNGAVTNSKEAENKECKMEMNGELPVTTKSDNVCSSTTTQENGEVDNSSPKGKGKAKPSKKTPQRPRRLHAPLYSLLDLEDTESSSSADESFDGGLPDDASTDEDAANTQEVSEDEEESDAEDEEEDEAEEDEDDDFANNIREEPGSDSGCTAVVALVRGNKAYVANAGDSRCIISRQGKAIDLSFDHKPEDPPELLRITTAGGKVTQDGRVNGGLNLSRAIGDHAYKQNKDLGDREQMITALPDIKIHEIDKKDEFMVLACDGIWNFMSSQEVIDFILPRLSTHTKLSTICEEMFEHCLAPNTMGDGTGCDNMTAIIIRFNQNETSDKTNEACEASGKRSAESPEEVQTKRVKIDK